MSGNLMAFLRSVENAAIERRVTEFLTLTVARYYEEYTDATELDENFAAALREVFDLWFWGGEDSQGREFDEIIRKPKVV